MPDNRQPPIDDMITHDEPLERDNWLSGGRKPVSGRQVSRAPEQNAKSAG
jgi:hypothetical protein